MDDAKLGGVKTAVLGICKIILKYILKNFISVGGLKGWLIKLVITEFYDEIAEPLIKLSMRKAGYIYEVNQGKHLLLEIENAENSDAWHDAINKL